MTDANQDFPEFAISYTKNARAIRDTLSEEVRAVLMVIDDELSEDPENYAHRTTTLNDGTFIYKYPKPAIELTCKIDVDRKVIHVIHIVAPALVAKKPLFISYSHQDKKWLGELRKFLDPLEKKDLVKIWDDRDIMAGDQWLEEIRNSLSSAKMAVLLVTQDFLTSDFICEKELPQLLQAAKSDGVKIFWIAVSASTVEDTDISEFQAVNNPAEPLDGLSVPKRKKELLEIYRKIKQVTEG